MAPVFASPLPRRLHLLSVLLLWCDKCKCQLSNWVLFWSIQNCNPSFCGLCPIPRFVLLHSTHCLITYHVFDSLLSRVWFPTRESTPDHGREVFRFTVCCDPTCVGSGQTLSTCVQCCQFSYNSSVLCLNLGISSRHPGKGNDSCSWKTVFKAIMYIN